MTPDWKEYLAKVVTGKKKVKQSTYPIYKLELRHANTWKDVVCASVDIPLPDVFYLLSSQAKQSDRRQSISNTFLDKILKLEIKKKFNHLFVANGGNQFKRKRGSISSLYLRVKISYVSFHGNMQQNASQIENHSEFSINTRITVNGGRSSANNRLHSSN
eukprot:UN08159